MKRVVVDVGQGLLSLDVMVGADVPYRRPLAAAVRLKFWSVRKND
jgi:hypothetical protein